MISKIKHKRHWTLNISPWIIIGLAGILLVIVVIMAIQNYNKEKKYISKILGEKGYALIKAVEAGTRTGMMGMRWGKQQVQTLLKEAARMDDVLFLAIIRKDGLILSHSKKKLVGSRFSKAFDMDRLKDHTINWEIVPTDEYGRSFIVYDRFRPVSTLCDSSFCKTAHTMMKQQKNGAKTFCFLKTNAKDDLIIVVGLDPMPFDHARKEDIRNTAIISGVLIVLGLAGFISIFWMHRFQSTSRTLQDTTAFTDKIISSLPVGLIATDKDGNIAFYNSSAKKITGIDLSRAIGKNPEDILPGNLFQLREKLNMGKTISEKEMECEFIRDKIIPVSISASQIINEEGQFLGQVFLIRDIGEVRQLQDEIRRKEKLAAIGGLAAGVAHEIRNPLSSIKGIATYYKGKFESGTEEEEMAGIMIEEVSRVNRVISELLEFSRQANLNLRVSDIGELLAHSVRLINQEAEEKNILVRLEPSPHAIKAEIDPDRISQCLLNLYLNAMQAMERGGELSISAFVRDDNFFVIEIKDRGQGISQEDLSKIFDPYFTTKSKGTGLGLAIVHKIIQAHKGSIEVRSALAKGSVFSVILPLQNKKTGL